MWPVSGWSRSGGREVQRPREGREVRRRRWRLVGVFAVIAWLASAPGSAAGFGTIDSGGQNREHERITRAALACADSAGSTMACFEPKSIDYLAGPDRQFGAVGAPDSDELSRPDRALRQCRLPRRRIPAYSRPGNCRSHG